MEQKREQQGETEMEKGRCRLPDGAVSFVVVQVGVVRFMVGGLNFLCVNMSLSTVNVCEEERVY